MPIRIRAPRVRRRRAPRRILDGPLPRYASGTPTTPKAVRRILAEVRERGVAYGKDDLDERVSSLAAPIFDADDHAVASLGLAGFSVDVEPRLGDLRAALRDATAEISRHLGGPPRPHPDRAVMSQPNHQPEGALYMTKHSLRNGVSVVAATALALLASGATSAARPASTPPESTVPSSSAGSAVPGSTMAPGALADLLPPEIAAAGELKVATSLYPPVTFYEEDGETLTGFDYEITEEIGSRLGVDIDWNVIDFANIMPGIESGQYDFATDLNDTAEREEVVDFVTEFRDGTSIMVPTGNPDSIAALEDLCGRTVVVTSGSTQVDLANTQSTACTDGGGDAIDLLEVPDDPDAMLAMNSGRADAYLVNTLAGSYAANTSDNADVELIDGVYDQVFAGFVLPKDSTMLRDAVLAAMQSLIDDGTYAEVMSSYGLENNMIESSVVNAAGS